MRRDRVTLVPKLMAPRRWLQYVQLAAILAGLVLFILAVWVAQKLLG